MTSSTVSVGPVTQCADVERELARARELYSPGGERERYAQGLVRFAHEHGWHVHFSRRTFCVQLLADPGHRHGRYCLRGAVPTGTDHVVLLRQGPPKNPSAWALLSQPYRDDAPGEPWGPAPYGHGTSAFLVDSRHWKAPALQQ